MGFLLLIPGKILFLWRSVALCCTASCCTASCRAVSCRAVISSPTGSAIVLSFLTFCGANSRDVLRWNHRSLQQHRCFGAASAGRRFAAIEWPVLDAIVRRTEVSHVAAPSVGVKCAPLQCSNLQFGSMSCQFLWHVPHATCVASEPRHQEEANFYADRSCLKKPSSSQRTMRSSSGSLNLTARTSSLRSLIGGFLRVHWAERRRELHFQDFSTGSLHPPDLCAHVARECNCFVVSMCLRCGQWCQFVHK